MAAGDERRVILALSTSSDVEQVALIDGDEVLGHSAVTWRRGQPRRLLWTIDRLLREAGAPALAAIAADVGPGSFTGLRLGLSTARALAWELGLPAIGVGAAEVLVHQARQRGASGPLVLWVPSRAGHVYRCSVEPTQRGAAAAFVELDVATAAAELVGAPPLTLVAPTSSLRQLPAAVADGHATVAIDAPDVVVIARLARAVLDHADLDRAEAAPAAAQPGHGAEDAAFGSWSTLVPHYVGVSEAERSLQVALQAKVLPVLRG